MSGPREAETAFFDKAQRAARSARLLLDAGDSDGACNRAYYAMFEAANAAILACGETDLPKTHSGLTARFHTLLVKPGVLPNDFGRSLKRGEVARLQADYSGAGVSATLAGEVVEMAERFVLGIGEKLPHIRA
ncbi:HEPN domain-containing protein [Bosea caraganae]|uniref:HEPN domain-containing protein n=1 Tax=Bosea caraganae TaxID=2763117 RepID=A0A370LBZ4_9HYPH|nr:HEPN domain-containing protein [Bosea caraganae]RDJ27471.1 HEPN domain-containing protein [Bosea caraganae]RDJ29486.1 HEPN domain-containing protein [Bosea caraganae]